jgi:sec-independent protein translocase protein TatC
VPVTMWMLFRGKLASYRGMRNRWREVTIAVFAVSGVFTPASVLTMFLVAIPTMLAYWVGLTGLWVITLGGRRDFADSPVETDGGSSKWLALILVAFVVVGGAVAMTGGLGTVLSDEDAASLPSGDDEPEEAEETAEETESDETDTVNETTESNESDTEDGDDGGADTENADESEESEPAEDESEDSGVFDSGDTDTDDTEDSSDDADETGDESANEEAEEDDESDEDEGNGSGIDLREPLDD